MSDTTPSPYNIEEVNTLIRKRRSVFPKDYSGENVPKEIIEQMLENANWAPTHGKTEPWRFFVFTGDSLKKLAEMQAQNYKDNTPEEDFQQAKYEKLQKKPLLASHIIAIAMERQASEKIPVVEEVAAVACAVQNMYLTATAYGIGAYWSTGGLTYVEDAKEFFGLGEKDKLMGFFYVGMLAQEPADSNRKPIEEKVTWV